MRKVIVFGSLNMDLSIESDRVPQAGETLSGRGFLANPGGKGANQAVAAAKLGAPTFMIGAVGRDTFGDQMISALKAADVRCEYVMRTPSCSTGVASIIRIGGDNRIILDAGANHALTADDIAQALDACYAGEGDVFLTQLECDTGATLSALAEARKRGMYTIFNPAPAVALPQAVWSSVNMVCLNETESEIITGVYPSDDKRAESVAARLQGWGVETVAITLGSRGSLVAAAGRVERAVPPAHQTIDTTCAGDTYIGAFAAALAAGADVRDAVMWASCASALATTKLGAQQSIPSRADVQKLVAAQKKRAVA